VLVDVLGLVIVALVTPASVQDRDGAVPVLRAAACEYQTIEHIWADGAYRGEVIDNVSAYTGIRVEVVKRSDTKKGFEPLPKRWIGERTFGWLNKYRILSKEYERTTESACADILHAMVMLMLRRLTTPAEDGKEKR
jgi:transposase